MTGIRLWLGLLLAPLAWLIHIIVSPLLLEWYCRAPSHLSEQTISISLHLLTLFSALLALSSFLFAWLGKHALSSNTQTCNTQTCNTQTCNTQSDDKNEGPNSLSRKRFMGTLGMLLSLFLFALILLQGWPNIMLRPC